MNWILVSILVIYGMITLFAREIIWKLTVLANQLSGRASARTKVWDAGVIITGILSLVSATILLLNN